MNRTDKIHLGTFVSTVAVGLGAGGYQGFCDAQNIPSSSGGLCLRLFGPTCLGFAEGAVAGSFTHDEECNEEGERFKHDTASRYACTYTLFGIASTLIGYGLGCLAGHLSK